MDEGLVPLQCNGGCVEVAVKGGRSEPLRAAATRIRSRAWGWLRIFAASPRARPAARTSPPWGAGSGVGEALGFGKGARSCEGQFGVADSIVQRRMETPG